MAIRWIARAKEGVPTSRPSALDAHEAFVVELIEDCKDLTLDEMVERLSVDQIVRISRVRLVPGFEAAAGRLRKPHLHWSKTPRMSWSEGAFGLMVSSISILND